MKSKFKLWLLPLIAILAVGVYIGVHKGGDFLQKQKAPQQQENLQLQTVVTKPIEKIKKESTIDLTGSVEALHEAVISAKTGGRVSKVNVENGSAVSTGNQLVLLESQEFTNALDVNRATLEKAKANLEIIQSNYTRMQTLFKEAAVSKKDFEEVETGLKVAEAEVNAASAAVANAQENLNNTTVSSPISGLVANRSVTMGQVVAAGTQLMAVEDISGVYVVVNIEQSDLAKIKLGQQAKVAVDTYRDRSFTGTVEIINPSANKSARVFSTKIKVNNRDHLLKPGMFAKVSIKTGESKEVPVVPQEALASVQGMYFVFIADGDKAKRQQVEIGEMINQSVEIKSGLSAGQKVIVTNVNKLKDQDRIRFE